MRSSNSDLSCTISVAVEEQHVLPYLPTVETPGYKLASPRAFQVLVALLDHARRFPSRPAPAKSPASDVPTSPPTAGANGQVAASTPVTPKPAKPKPTKERRRAPKKPKQPCSNGSAIPITPGLESQWTVTGLAHACGCNRNTAGAVLSELVALGWIRKSIGRHSGGEYSGFWFRLLVPPSTLTTTAQHLYQSRADEAEFRLRERRERLKESITDDRDDDAGSAPASLLDSPVKEVI